MTSTTRTLLELNHRGHDVVHVNDLGLAGAADPVVFDTAVAQQRIVVTVNFADYVVLLDQRLRSNPAATPVVFAPKADLPRRGALSAGLAGGSTPGPPPTPALTGPDPRPAAPADPPPRVKRLLAWPVLPGLGSVVLVTPARVAAADDGVDRVRRLREWPSPAWGRQRGVSDASAHRYHDWSAR